MIINKPNRRTILGVISLIFLIATITWHIWIINSPVGEQASCYNDYGNVISNQTIVYEQGNYRILSGIVPIMEESFDSNCDENYGICPEIKQVGTGWAEWVTNKNTCVREKPIGKYKDMIKNYTQFGGN